MSLEASIEELTIAVRALTHAFASIEGAQHVTYGKAQVFESEAEMVKEIVKAQREEVKKPDPAPAAADADGSSNAKGAEPPNGQQESTTPESSPASVLTGESSSPAESGSPQREQLVWNGSLRRTLLQQSNQRHNPDVLHIERQRSLRLRRTTLHGIWNFSRGFGARSLLPTD